jgi:hypothetical protein
MQWSRWVRTNGNALLFPTSGALGSCLSFFASAIAVAENAFLITGLVHIPLRLCDGPMLAIGAIFAGSVARELGMKALTLS